ncbi:hypothetical protein AOQ84DRAFT_59400 [Glonium stellatum]|uniref:Uncharacterized protein n=1 Tax=Glonium stellatum TaxID=574774 RepID=A0A8E2EYW1_9PEZI|nr:hypothetical protein AOQ84DRAFT_59400 [Glonium stellatum]
MQQGIHIQVKMYQKKLLDLKRSAEVDIILPEGNEQSLGHANGSSPLFQPPLPTNAQLKCSYCSYRPSGEIKWRRGNLERHIRNVHHLQNCAHDGDSFQKGDCSSCFKTY